MGASKNQIPEWSQVLPLIPSTKLKRDLAKVIQELPRKGPLGITRQGKLAAVLVSADQWEAIAEMQKKMDPLNHFRIEYEERLADLEAPETERKLEQALSASPEDLGAAAIEYAKHFP